MPDWLIRSLSIVWLRNREGDCSSFAYLRGVYFFNLLPEQLLWLSLLCSAKNFQLDIYKYDIMEYILQQNLHVWNMIKHVLISRLSDGLILCETSQGGFNESFESLKMQIKNYHRESTSKSGVESTSLKQIQNASYGVYYRVNSYVVFTAITQLNYPIKLINAFLQMIASSFFDQAKCILGSSNISSRIQNIEGSHFFVRFDRIIKQKKKQFDDPNSVRNIDRMKKQLQSIHDIMKQNMTMMNNRHQDLVNTQEKAYRINEESKKFEKKSKSLVWHLWIRKNLIWLILALVIIVVYFLF